jgi:glutathione S-transferase
MRARMALIHTAAKIEIREILLKDKPDKMLRASPKGTVPVLILDEETVLEESMDIMNWCLDDNDAWHAQSVPGYAEISNRLIMRNDNFFKTNLDKYKYGASEEKITHRTEALVFLYELDKLLTNNKNLLSNEISVADIAIFPFVRQFSKIDSEWFNDVEFKYLHGWLNNLLNSDLFESAMKKHPLWSPGAKAVFL